MKKLLFLSKVCLMALIMVSVPACTRDDNESDGESNGGNNGGATGEFVDLGLSSGTKWRDMNESLGDFNLFSYEQAMTNFGYNLPTKEQFEELQHSCMWTWNDNGYKILGPNGNSIVLPAAGHRWSSGGVDGVGSEGHYWSSSPYGSDGAWGLIFASYRSPLMDHYYIYEGMSVRLVQN